MLLFLQVPLVPLLLVHVLVVAWTERQEQVTVLDIRDLGQFLTINICEQRAMANLIVWC